MYANKTNEHKPIPYIFRKNMTYFQNCDFLFILWILSACRIRTLQLSFPRRPVPDQISELNSGACSPPSAVTATCSSSTNWRCDSRITSQNFESSTTNLIMSITIAYFYALDWLPSRVYSHLTVPGIGSDVFYSWHIYASSSFFKIIIRFTWTFAVLLDSVP